MKIYVDYSVVTCDGIVDTVRDFSYANCTTPESEVINPIDGISYWSIAIVLLAIAYLLLLVAMVVKYDMKYKLAMPCL